MTALAGWLGKIILGVLLEKLRAWISAFATKQKQTADDHAAAGTRSDDDAKKAAALKPESPAEDVDAAIDDETSHF